MRTYYLYLLLLPICVFICACSKQSNNLSLYLHEAERLMDTYPDSSLLILEQVKQPESLSPKDHAFWCLLYTQARDKNYIVHTSDSLIRYAMEYYEQHPDEQHLMLAYYYMGRVSQDMQLAPRAQEYYKKALTTGGKSNDHNTIGLINNHLGVLYTHQYAYDLALPYLKESYKYYKLLNDIEGVSYALRDIARVYHQREQLDSAKYYYEKALEAFHPDTQSSVLTELAGVLVKDEKYEIAKQYLQTALKYASDSTDFYPIYLVLGKIYLGTGSLDSARYYLTKSLSSSQEMTVASANYNLLQIAEQQNDIEKGWKFLNDYIQLRSVIEKSQNNAAIQQVEAMYNFQQIEQEAEHYKLKKTILERNMLRIALVTILLITGLILYLFSVRIQKNSLNAQKELLLKFIERQTHDSKTQLRINNERIDIIKVLPQKEVLNLERQLLESENERIEQDMKMQFHMQIELSQQKELNLFRNKNTTITEDNIENLQQIINHNYPSFETKLIEFGLYNDQGTRYLCYLLKAGIKYTRIAELMNITPQAITNKRNSLYRKIQIENSSFKSFDDFISTI